MAEAVKHPARVRTWVEEKTWRRDHNAKGAFQAVNAGQRETLRIPIFMHPCSECGAPYAPWGYNGIWFCKEHRP